MSHKTLHTHSPKFERLVPLQSCTSAHLGRFKDEEHRRTKRASRTYVSFFVIHSIILDLLLPPTPQYLVSPQIYEMNIESNKSLCAQVLFCRQACRAAVLTLTPARDSHNLTDGLDCAGPQLVLDHDDCTGSGKNTCTRLRDYYSKRARSGK